MNSLEILKNLQTKDAKYPIHFHAYFWGKFVLIPNKEEDGYILFAKPVSRALNYKLNLKDDQVFLHNEMDDWIFLTDNLMSLFQNKNQTGESILYDCRPRLSDLFTTDQMYLTEFRDPEDFEDVEAYVKLINGIDTHFNNIFALTEINGIEEDEIKYLKLKSDEHEQEIILKKELFDLQLLQCLARFLKKLGILQEAFYLTIDSKMNMIILKLDSTTYEETKRIGLIV